MTIFDTLRYPVSNPPTLEQIRALPKPILKEFLEYVSPDTYMVTECETMEEVENLRIEVCITIYEDLKCYSKKTQDRLDFAMKALRKLIEEYEDDNL